VAKFRADQSYPASVRGNHSYPASVRGDHSYHTSGATTTAQSLPDERHRIRNWFKQGTVPVFFIDNCKTGLSLLGFRIWRRFSPKMSGFIFIKILKIAFFIMTLSTIGIQNHFINLDPVFF